MEEEKLLNLRHSCAHLLAAAVLDLYPKTKLAIGPAIENGFYYDFEFKEHLSEKDLPKIEKKMRELVKKWESVDRTEVTKEEARKEFKGNPYKFELIDEIVKKKEPLTVYWSGKFKDLCRGGHVKNPSKELKHFKLLSIAGAYWRGDEKNKMLTRIYGTCFPTKQELDKYLWQLEEAKKRDHKKLGKDLDLFLISKDIGGGLPIFTPKGTILRNIIEKYLIELKRKNHYQFVWTPHIARGSIYKTSGHLGKYDAMFNPMKLDREDYYIRPMNCPHHFQIYLNKPRSYRELPMRIAENGTVYRNEKSGELNGLFRARSLTIDDTHTIMKFQDTHEELVDVLNMIKEILKDFGFSDYVARISLSDPKNREKYIGDRQEWERAESALKRTVEHLGMEPAIGIGEAAFYGPKIDIMVRDSIGREWQLSTVQLDYQQPHNFKLTYTDRHGAEIPAVVLHIAMIGSLERFIGILIEHYAGAFPLWLAPIQVAVLPVSEKHNKKALDVVQTLENGEIRAELGGENKTLGNKIRAATLQKIPYLVIIGYRESEATVAVRTREGKDLGQKPLKDFIASLKKDIEKFS